MATRLRTVPFYICRSMQRLSGRSVVEKVLENIMEKQVFYHIYLFDANEDKTKGTIHIHIIYDTRKDGTNEDGTSADDTPYFSGFFEQTIDLPFDGYIHNPMFSPAAAKYLLDTWMKQPAFWSMSVMNMLRVGLGMHIAASNQHSEANFKHVKAQPDLRIHCSEPAAYLHHVWGDQQQSLKLFVKEYESARTIMDGRKQKAKSKKETKTVDAIENESYNNTGAKWGNGKRSHKEEEKVRKQLVAIFEILSDTKVITGRNANTWRTFMMKYHAENNVGDLNKMGKSTWREYLFGRRDPQKRVEGSNMILFESFIDDYNKSLGIEVLNG